MAARDDDNDEAGARPRGRGGERRVRSDPVIVVPKEVEVEHEITAPVIHFTRGPDDADRAIIDALGVDPDAPAPRQLLYREYNARRRHETAQDAALRGLASRQLSIGDLETRILDAERWQTDAKTWLRGAKRAAISALGAAALSLGAFIGAVYHRATQEGGDAVRLQRLEEDVRDQKRQIEKLLDIMIKKGTP